MKLLLDTHVLLWTVEESDILDEGAKREIGSEENVVFVSMASLWELEIKRSLKKIHLPDRFYKRLPAFGYEILSISLDHIQAVGALPLYHRDPFDRMLVAQAQQEQLTLVTRDVNIAKYKVTILKA